MHSVKKPWWQQATALVTVTTGGVIAGFNFVPGAAETMTSPTSVPLHLLALEQAGQPGAAMNARAVGGDSADAATGNTLLRSAIVNVAKYYLQLAQTRTPAQTGGADLGQHQPERRRPRAVLRRLRQPHPRTGRAGGRPAELGQRRRPATRGRCPRGPTSGSTPNPASPDITSMVTDAQAHGRWQPLGDGYQPQPGDWVLFDAPRRGRHQLLRRRPRFDRRGLGARTSRSTRTPSPARWPRPGCRASSTTATWRAAAGASSTGAASPQARCGDPGQAVVCACRPRPHRRPLDRTDPVNGTGGSGKAGAGGRERRPVRRLSPASSSRSSLRPARAMASRPASVRRHGAAATIPGAAPAAGDIAGASVIPGASPAATAPTAPAAPTAPTAQPSQSAAATTPVSPAATAIDANAGHADGGHADDSDTDGRCLRTATPTTSPSAATSPAASPTSASASASSTPAATPAASASPSASPSASAAASKPAAKPYRQYAAPAQATPGTRAQQAFISLVAPGAVAAQQR